MRTALYASGALCLMIFFSGCATAPQKSYRLPPALQQQYLKQPLTIPLTLPVQGIKRQQLQDSWGAPRSGGRLHEGIDIIAPKGRKVLSATDGVVTDIRSSNLGGQIIWIYGPRGSWHYYAHLDGFKRGLEVGDQVEAGDVIGYVGNSGNARGGAPHLHYGIYLSAKGRGAVNPYPYLR